jgi:hypothetical protein
METKAASEMADSVVHCQGPVTLSENNIQGDPADM